MMNKREVGAQAERIAAHHLQSKGWTLLDQNWSCPGGELDLVFDDGADIVFVEVRSAQSSYLPGIDETVNREKQRRVARSAELWLTHRRPDSLDYRFDVLTVRFEQSCHPTVLHFEDAFVAPWAF